MAKNYCVNGLVMLTTILVLFPLISCKNPKYKLSFKILSWILVVFIAVVGPLSIIVKDEIFTSIPTSSRVVFDLCFMFLYAGNIHISLTVIFKQKELSVLLEKLVEALSSSHNFISYLIAFLAILSLNTIFLIVTQFQRTENLNYYLTVIMVEGFLSGRLTTALFVIFLLIKNIKEDFKIFNQKLQETCRNANIVQNYRCLHNNLCNVVEHINSQFGVILLLTCFYIITSFLRHAAFIRLNYSNSLVLTVRCLWIATYGFQAGYLAHIGEQLSMETKRTVSICYEIMQKVSIHEVCGNTNKQLFLLSQQAFNRQVSITAAGFFNIDHSMILFIATTFCTYFIVVMQFMFNNNGL